MALKLEPIIRRSFQWLTATSQEGIITQIEEALQSRPSVVAGALLLGAIWGGFVPVAVFEITHVEKISLRAPLSQWDPLHYVVVAGLVFSSTSVWAWGRTLCNAVKAAVFVSLLEGTMILSKTTWLSGVAIGLIVVTNMLVVGARAAKVEAAKQADKDDRRDAPREATRTTPLVDDESLYERAVLLAQTGSCSINSLKRSLGIGWTKAAALGDRLEREGFSAKGGKRSLQTQASGSWQTNEAAQG